jgi:predicted MFS family arabinose efflux permease
MVAHSLSMTLILAPVGLAAVSCGLVVMGTFSGPTAVLLALWGMIGTGAPVAWWTWVARQFPKDAEAAGGLLVAVVQFAITLGAAGGGFLFDTAGYRTSFLSSAALLGASALLAALSARREPYVGQPTVAPGPGRAEPQVEVAQTKTWD